MVKTYNTKNVQIEAIRFMPGSLGEILQWTKPHAFVGEYDDTLIIKTLEGNMQASWGDYIIKGLRGEFYPCKCDVFEKDFVENSIHANATYSIRSMKG